MMDEMLTAKEVQLMLQVDRSTVYRMAEDGRLPAVRVGKQWRFPAQRLQEQFDLAAPDWPAVAAPNKAQIQADDADSEGLKSLLPLECVQLIQNSFADLLGVMLVVTDMDGRLITRPSHTCGLFEAILEIPGGLQKCMDTWRALAHSIDLEPQFSPGHLGMLCCRAMIRVGPELKGMVVAGGVAPPDWPPPAAEVAALAAELGARPEQLTARLPEVFYLDQAAQRQVLVYLQRMATIVAHIVNERQALVGRLERIAHLTRL